jgi:uncharacterized protein YjbI with pentapeptide repeats
MATLTHPCRYKSPLDASFKCGHPPVRDGYCIFHVGKLSNTEKSALTSAKREEEERLDADFRQALIELIDKTERGISPHGASTTSSGIHDFRGFNFPSFEFKAAFTRGVNFTDAKFHGEVVFRGVTFKEKVLLSRAKFRQGADFSFTHFEGHADLSGISFDTGLFSANFTGAEFDNKAAFSHAAFHTPAYFSGAVFGKEQSVTFTNARFYDDALFSGTQFHGWTFMNNVIFSKGANFSRAEFQQFLNFRDTKLSTDSKLDFYQAIFRGADFTKINFHDANFTSATFIGGAEFNSAIFDKGAKFGDATFQQKVGFVGAVFNQGVEFEGTIFEHIADFSGATFSGKVRFIGWHENRDIWGLEDLKRGFHDECRFRRVTLEKDVEVIFENTDLGKASFTDSNVEHLIFRDVKWCREESRLKRWPRELLFVLPNPRRRWLARHRPFGKHEDARLYELRTIQNYFEDPYRRANSMRMHLDTQIFINPARNVADLITRESLLRLLRAEYVFAGRAIKFCGDLILKWCDPRSTWAQGISREQALWSEFYLLTDEQNFEYERIAENYRQLVLNYERTRDYSTAENFHAGEMEVRRKALGSRKRWWKIWGWINALDIYRFSSRYGTSYVRALTLLLVTFIFVTISLMCSGFCPETKDNSNCGGSNLIEYNLISTPGYRPATTEQWFTDLGKSALFTFSIISFQRGEYYKPASEYSQFLVSMAVLVFAGEADLLFLAIRRRFRR